MNHSPPERVKSMMMNCIEAIHVFTASTIASYCEEMPDIEENKAIFIDSVIAASIVKTLLERTATQDPNFRRKYIRNLMSHVKELCYEQIRTEEVENDAC